MVIKIKTRKDQSWEQLIKYMMKDPARLKEEKGKTFTILHNVKGKTIKEWAKTFKENEQYRTNKRKDNAMLQHAIISFSNLDRKNISVDILRDIAYQYISLRNSNGIFFIVPHFEKGHLHIHVCNSTIERFTGKSMRLSKDELKTLKIKMQEYQMLKYPSLTHSIVQHGKRSHGRQMSDKEYQATHRLSRNSEKEHVKLLLEKCFRSSNSLENFYNLLNTQGLKTYTRGKRIYGVTHESLNYRFSTLGYTPEHLNTLTVRKQRGENLRQMRTTEITKERE